MCKKSYAAMPRRNRRIPLLLLLAFIVLCINFLYPILFRKHEDFVPPSVEYTFNNVPYGDIKNGSCEFLNTGHWNCPDIRRQGRNTLRQIHFVMMRMLLIFDAIAKKYNLRYWITRGSLLGAARHKGFIPWDSDLDIEMPIEDYLIFFVKASKDLPPDTALQQHEKEKHFFRLYKDDVLHMNAHDKQKLANLVLVPWNPRLRDQKSCYKNCLKLKCPWEDGLQIDIYPIYVQDGYYQDQFVRSKVKKLWRFIGGFLGFNTGDYSAYPLRVLQFEGFDIPVPNQWENLLQNVYGENYMELPPKDKQTFYEAQMPDPVRSCSEFDENGYLKSATLKDSYTL